MHPDPTAMFDRRTSGGKPTVDRRKTYVDIIERVLGSSLPTGRPARSTTRFREVSFGTTIAWASTSSVQVTVLDHIPIPEDFEL